MAYTINDTAATVARIEQDLTLVRDLVAARDPGLRSLVLTGGFARGEGAVMDGDPQNDYDLIAIRGIRRPRVAYEKTRQELEERLGLHIDLAPVSAWRLRLAAPSIFWYETRERGQVLWGEDLLSQIPRRTPDDLNPQEGLRLLVNRAAGLLLVTEDKDPHQWRIQAAKGLLAALDVHLLAAGRFAPSQKERWQVYQELSAQGTAPIALTAIEEELAWAFRFKVDPANAPPRDATEMWQSARRAILDAVPVALHYAHLPTLEAYARQDGILDRIYYLLHAGDAPGAKRLIQNPTGRVRHATLRFLEDAPYAAVEPQQVQRHLEGLVTGPTARPLSTLETLRQATLQ